MKNHLLIYSADPDHLKIIKALVGTYHTWNNAINSFNTQIALRELKAVMKDADAYCEALYNENTRARKDTDSGRQSGNQETHQENADHPEPPVLPATENGESASAV